jgi:hypothetical protein
MFAIFGTVGQLVFNSADARPAIASKPSAGTTWMNSKWSPVKALSDGEYENMLREKLLQVDAEIALVDENIETLRLQDSLDARDVKKESKG